MASEFDARVRETARSERRDEDAIIEPGGKPAGGDPMTLWLRWHALLARVADIPCDAGLDRFVALQLETELRGKEDRSRVLEASCRFGASLVPSVRLVIYRGPLPEDPGGAEVWSHGLVDLLAPSAATLGQSLSLEFLDILRAFVPFRLPMGFEAVGERLDFKVYVEFCEMAAGLRKDLVTQLARLLEPPAAIPTLDWQRLTMCGMTLRAGSLAALKLYFEADPTEDWTPYGLSPPSPGPVLALPPGRALAVLDLSGRSSRPKWDFSLRDRALDPRAMTAVLARALASRARHALERLQADPGIRLDPVALGVRADETTFYFDLA